METKENNKRLLIVVGVLLLVVGVSLAYFVSNILINGKGANTKITTAVIKGATLNIEGILEFEDLEILPGHKTASGIKVTATGNNELIPYNLIWNGTNTLTTPLEFKIYKTSEEIEVNATCEKKRKAVGSVTQISEECSITNIDKLGTEIASGRINKNDTKVILAKDEFITATSTGDVKYYYVILEYPNLNEAQNYDLEGSLEGKVTVEESNIKPDINILAIQIEQEDGSYQEVEEIPQSGYAVNTSKSTCSNGARPIGITPNITVKGLTKSGTSCYLYLDKAAKEVNTLLGNLTVKTNEPDFSINAYVDEGVYETSDEMYGGTSYYWRGAATTNYLKFGGFCWRIVRINGDGSLRLIYDGSTCHANGTSTTESVIVGATNAEKYYATSDGQYNNSSYVGWTYTLGSQRPVNNNTAISSNIKIQTEKWFNTNITGTNLEKVADGKFCNDRNVDKPLSTWESGYIDIWSDTGTKFGYAGPKRLYELYQPTLKCNPQDIYIMKVGAITADEVEFAGSKNENNYNYYLYNGQNYFTMTPYFWSGSFGGVFRVDLNGYLAYVSLDWTSSGLRPVINLKSDIIISSGNGTLDNPYIVAD